MSYPGPFPIKVEQGGTGEIALAANAVLIGQTADDIGVTNVGTNGQLLIGATAAPPAFASLTSSGGTIVITTGANTLNIEASGSTSSSFPTDSGTAVPALGALTIAGGANIATSGSGSTVTIDLDGVVPIANGGTNASSMATTDGTVIFDGTRLVTTATGTSGQVLTSNGVGVAPTYQNVSASGAVTSVSGGNNITITGTATAPIVNVSGTTNHAVQVGNSTNSLTSLSVGTNGQVLLGATAADPSFITPTAGTGLSITTNATTLQYALSTPVSVSNGGTGASSFTAHSLILGQGTSAMTALGAATNGQLPIGSTGADPVLATLTAGTGISVTNGAGSITLAASATTPLVFHTGSGDATPAANAITIAGGNNISTTGSGSTVTVAVSGTTNHTVQVGNASGSLTSLTAGTNGQVLLGSTGADPAFITPTAGTGLSITTNATTLQYALSTPVSVSNGGTGATSFTAHSLILGQGTSAMTALGAATNGQIPIGSTGADPVLATITAGSGITVTNGAGSITIAASGGTGITWNEITTTSQSMAVNNGYIANNAGLVTLTLPSTAAQGSIIEVTGKGAGGWKIAQNSGQTIYFGTSTTTTGTGGSLASSATRDGVRLVCITANNDFNVLSAQGNLTVV
jgi:hypothetical protein